MNIDEARKYLAQAGRTGINLGLSRMKKLLELLGNPQEELLFIHVAGTNGKGSVCTYLSSVLSAGGFRVGRYSSPAVFSPSEFIQYEEGPQVHFIDDELFAEVVTETAEAAERMKREYSKQERVKDFFKTFHYKQMSLSPTRFELETAMAFLAFRHWKCDVVVLEVGLGGREDATNVINNALLSVITPISMDHMAILGDTIEEIAAEKAGIIRKAVPVVTMQRDERALHVIEQVAEKKASQVFSVHAENCEIIEMGIHGSRFCYADSLTAMESGQAYLQQEFCYETKMVGRYQIYNACLAIEACRHLSAQFQVSKEKVRQGIRRAMWRGRFEIVSEKPLIILDGAHNPAGAEALRETIEELFLRKLHAVMGVFKDKDYEEMVSIVSPLFQDVVTITPRGERGLDKELLAQVWRANGCRDVFMAESVEEALELAKKRCREGEGIVVFGSLSFMNEISG